MFAECWQNLVFKALSVWRNKHRIESSERELKVNKSLKIKPERWRIEDWELHTSLKYELSERTNWQAFTKIKLKSVFYKNKLQIGKLVKSHSSSNSLTISTLLTWFLRFLHPSLDVLLPLGGWVIHGLLFYTSRSILWLLGLLWLGDKNIIILLIQWRLCPYLYTF